MTTAEEAIERYCKAGRDEQRRLSRESYDRIRDFVLAAAEDPERPALEGWRGSIHDAVLDLDQIVCQPDVHPDTDLHARAAVGSFAKIWLDDEAFEALALGIDA
jgi:hypothetical protein